MKIPNILTLMFRKNERFLKKFLVYKTVDQSCSKQDLNAQEILFKNDEPKTSSNK